jgi:hypothetical protein
MARPGLKKKKIPQPVTVAHAHNPSYSGDQPQANSSRDPISKILKRAGGVAQAVSRS